MVPSLICSSWPFSQVKPISQCVEPTPWELPQKPQLLEFSLQPDYSSELGRFSIKHKRTLIWMLTPLLVSVYLHVLRQIVRRPCLLCAPSQSLCSLYSSVLSPRASLPSLLSQLRRIRSALLISSYHVITGPLTALILFTFISASPSHSPPSYTVKVGQNEYGCFRFSLLSLCF